VKESLLPKTDWMDITVSIKDCEGIAMKKDTSSIVCE